MSNSQKGFTVILFLVGILIVGGLIVSGAYFYKSQIAKNSQNFDKNNFEQKYCFQLNEEQCKNRSDCRPDHLPNLGSNFYCQNKSDIILPSITQQPSVSTGSSKGIIRGKVNIGPLTPVERVGVPTPTLSSEVCTSRGLSIYNQNGNALITTFFFLPDCTYIVELFPGTYVVKLKDSKIGIGGSKTLPRTITLQGNKTVTLDIDIDTGIR